MTTMDSNTSNQFSIRFTSRGSFMEPVGTRKPNPFGLTGSGTLAIGATQIEFIGKRAQVFGIGPSHSVTFQRDAIVNVERIESKVIFEHDSGAIKTLIVFWAKDADEAATIVAQLPQKKTEEYVKSVAEKSDFVERLEKVSPTALVTPLLVGLNIVAFIWTTLMGAGFLVPDGVVMIGLGSDFGPLTTSGQWWRLMTSTFLHFGVLHLALNMWALLSTGQLVERLYGSGRFLLMYLLAGLTGSIASVAWNPSVNSAGASGAIFGVFGALLAFVVNKKVDVPTSIIQQHKTSTLVFIAYNLFNGFARTGIDNAAHIGGLVGGFVVGWLLARPVTDEARAESGASSLLNAIGAGVLFVALGIGSLYMRSPDFGAEQRFRAAMIQYSLEEDKYLEVVSKNPIKGSDSEIADRFDREILAYWKRMSAAITAAPLLPDRSSLHDFQAAILEYVDTRLRGMQAFVDGHKKRDAALIHESERLIEQSDNAFAKAQRMHVEL